MRLMLTSWPCKQLVSGADVGLNCGSHPAACLRGHSLKLVRGFKLTLSASAFQKKIKLYSPSDGLRRISNHPCSIALHMACCSNLMKYAVVTLPGLKSIYTWSHTGGTWHSVLQLIVTRRLHFPSAPPHSRCCCCAFKTWPRCWWRRI